MKEQTGKPNSEERSKPLSRKSMFFLSSQTPESRQTSPQINQFPTAYPGSSQNGHEPGLVLGSQLRKVVLVTRVRRGSVGCARGAGGRRNGRENGSRNGTVLSTFATVLGLRRDPGGRGLHLRGRKRCSRRRQDRVAWVMLRLLLVVNGHLRVTVSRGSRLDLVVQLMNRLLHAHPTVRLRSIVETR